MHDEIGAGVVQPLRHAQDRCYANAACQQQRAPSRVRQRKMVLRFADMQKIAFTQSVMHRDRSTARLRVAQHADLVVAGLRGVIAQRVLAHQTGRSLHIDMGACRKSR